jgi:hypothetical protein
VAVPGELYRPSLGRLSGRLRGVSHGRCQTSFPPLRRFESLEDLQFQHDSWARTVAFERQHRRVGAKVADARWVERGFLTIRLTAVPAS